jgi:hypothetical protein
MHSHFRDFSGIKSRFLQAQIAVLLFALQNASAYPQFIKNGYMSCLNCHNSSLGGGTLNAYGKGIGAAESFYTKEVKEEPIPFFENGFLGRGMVVSQEAVSVFPMQLDYLATLRPTATLSLESNLGLQPIRVLDRVANPTWIDYFVLRKLVANYRPSESLAITAGRDFLPVGLHTADHTFYVSARNRRNTTDFQTQIRSDFLGEKYQITPFVYLPSFNEAKPNRERGLGLRGEFLISESNAIGASLLFGSTPSVQRELYTLFARTGHENWGVLAELDYTHRKNSAAASFSQFAFLVQPFYNPKAWLEMSVALEGLTIEKPYFDRLYRLGPSALFRLHQYFSFQADARFEITRTNESFGIFAFQAIIGIL